MSETGRAMMRQALMMACGAALLCGPGAVATLGIASAQEAPPSAQDARAPSQAVGNAVAAVVNDHPISTFDVQQRVRLMMASSGAQLDDRAVAQMQDRALRDLVEERLKLQEAERFDLSIAEEDIDAEVAQVAAGGGATPQQLEADLAAQGIAIETWREKLRSEIAWDRLVGGRYGDRVSITDSEVEDHLTGMRDATQKPQFYLSEICLPAEGRQQSDEMRAVGMQMIEQMQTGVPFRAIAQQYSACPSAARGGELGWVSLEDLEPNIQAVLPQMAVGNVSLPIPTEGMVKMIALQQAREAATAGELAYEFVYAGASKSIGREVAAEAFAKLPRTNACRADALSEDLGPGVGVTALPMLPASAIDPAFQPTLEGLDAGQVSDIMESETAFHAVLLCQKDEGLGLPSRQQVRSQLRDEQLDRLGRRYLRDVERDGAIDLRMGDGQG